MGTTLLIIGFILTAIISWKLSKLIYQKIDLSPEEKEICRHRILKDLYENKKWQDTDYLRENNIEPVDDKLRVVIYEIDDETFEKCKNNKQYPCLNNKILDKVYSFGDDEYNLFISYHRHESLFTINDETYIMVNEFCQNKSFNSTITKTFVVLSISKINFGQNILEYGMIKNI